MIAFNSVGGLRDGPVLQLRSSYLTSRMFRTESYSYTSRLHRSVGVVTRGKDKVVFRLRRRNHKRNLSGGVRTMCGVRDRTLSTTRSFRTLNLRRSIHSCTPTVGILGKVRVGRIHLMSGGPHGQHTLRRTKVRMRLLGARPRVQPRGVSCLGDGGRGLKRYLPLNYRCSGVGSVLFCRSSRA